MGDGTSTQISAEDLSSSRLRKLNELILKFNKTTGPRSSNNTKSTTGTRDTELVQGAISRSASSEQQADRRRSPAASLYQLTHATRKKHSIVSDSTSVKGTVATKQRRSQVVLPGMEEVDPTAATRENEISPNNYPNSSPVHIRKAMRPSTQPRGNGNFQQLNLKKLSNSSRSVIPRHVRQSEDKASSEIVRKHSNFINNLQI